jgi:WD40 repeat protein
MDKWITLAVVIILPCVSSCDQNAEDTALNAYSEPVRSLAFLPDSKRLVSLSRDGTVTLWDTATGRELHMFKGPSGKLLSFAFSPEGKFAASGSDGKTITVWDAVTGKVSHTVQENSGGWVVALAFSPDGSRFASASSDLSLESTTWDSWITLRDAATGTRLRRFYLSRQGPACSLAFSPDGKQLASGHYDFDGRDIYTVNLWDAVTGKELLTLKGHVCVVRSVAFSPDGRSLASRSGDKTIKLWDTATGKVLLTLDGRPDVGRSVAFSPDGKSLASGGDGGAVKVWDTATGKLLFTLDGRSKCVRSLAFSPDGKLLAAGSDASGSDDGTIRIWDVSDRIKPRK